MQPRLVRVNPSKLAEMAQNKSRAQIVAVVAALVTCLVLLQVHATLHVHAAARPYGQRGPTQNSHGPSAPDCQGCVSSAWMAPERAPHVEGLAPGFWLETSPQLQHSSQSASRQTAPRAPPLV